MVWVGSAGYIADCRGIERQCVKTVFLRLKRGHRYYCICRAAALYLYAFSQCPHHFWQGLRYASWVQFAIVGTHRAYSHSSWQGPRSCSFFTYMLAFDIGKNSRQFLTRWHVCNTSTHALEAPTPTEVRIRCIPSLMFIALPLVPHLMYASVGDDSNIQHPYPSQGKTRNIASGLRAFYKLEEMQGRRVIVLANLKARNIGGFKSEGMVSLFNLSQHNCCIRRLTLRS